MADTLATQIKRLHETNPDLPQSEIARIIGCSAPLVSMVLAGKRGTSEAPAEGDTSEDGAAQLALEKAKQALRAQLDIHSDAKEIALLADAGLKNARTWAVFAGKATNRSEDRDEMSKEESKAILEEMQKAAGVPSLDEKRERSSGS